VPANFPLEDRLHRSVEFGFAPVGAPRVKPDGLSSTNVHTEHDYRLMAENLALCARDVIAGDAGHESTAAALSLLAKLTQTRISYVILA